MSQTIDERVVELKFNNAQFESNVKTSMSTLDKLKEALKLDGAKKGLEDVSKSAQNVNLSPLEQGVKALQDQFSLLGIAALKLKSAVVDTAFNAINKGIHTVTDSIVQGGIKRAMSIEQAHFQLQGLVGDEEEVKAIMDNAMDSVDGTAYAYNEAAKAAAMFATTGMRSGDQMVSSLRAIAGTAAMGGAEYERVANIFTTVAGNGRLMGDQLLQLSSQGLNAAATITDYFNAVTSGSKQTNAELTAAIRGVTEGTRVTEQDIRQMVSKGKISFEMFAAAMDDAFGEHAKKANDTFTGAMANVKASLARIGAEFVSPLIVQNGPLVEFFNELRLRINDLKAAILPVAKMFTDTINSMATGAKNILAKFGTDLGKIDLQNYFKALLNVVDALINVFSAFGAIIRPFVQAFQEVFPPPVTARVVETTDAIRSFTERLILSENASRGLKNILVAILKPIKALLTLIKPIAKVVAGIVIVIGTLIRSFLELFDTEKQLKVHHKELSEGFSNLTVFEKFASVISKIVTGFKDFIGVIITYFDALKRTPLWIQFTQTFEKFATLIGGTVLAAVGAVTSKFADLTGKLPDCSGALKVLDTIVHTVIRGLTVFFQTITDIGKNLPNLGEKLGLVKQGFDGFIQAITKGAGDGKKKLGELATSLGQAGEKIFTKDNIIKALELGFAAVVLKLIYNFQLIIKNFQNWKLPVIGALQDTLTAIKNVLNAYQKDIKAGALEKVAIAIGILVASIYALSTIPLDKLVQSILGLGIVGVALVKFMKELDKLESDSKKLLAIGTSILELGIAFNFLAGAVKLFSMMDMDTFASGLIRIGVILFGFLKATEMIKAGAKEMVAFAGSVLLMANALTMLSVPIILLGVLPDKILGQGVVTVVGLILTLAGATKLLTQSATQMVAGAAAMMLMATAITMISIPLALLGALGWGVIIPGIIGVAFGMGLMIAALYGLTKLDLTNSIITAAGAMMMMAIAIDLLIVPILAFGAIPIEMLQQGLGGLAVALMEMWLAIAGFSAFGSGNMVAAAGSMILLAAALNLLVIPITLLGALPWSVVEQGLNGMGLALLILLGAGVIAGIPLVTTGLMVLAGVLLAAGAGAMMAGVGFAAFGAGLLMVAAAIPILIADFFLIVNSIKVVVTNITNLIKENGPQILSAITTTIGNIINFIITNIPVFLQTIGNLFIQIVQLIIQNGPAIITGIANILKMAVTAILAFVGEFFKMGIELIGAFIKGIANDALDLVQTGLMLVRELLTSMLDGAPEFLKVGIQFILGVIDGLISLIGDLKWAVESIIDSGVEVFNGGIDAFIQAGIDLVGGLIDGILGAIDDVVGAAKRLGGAVINALNSKEGLDEHSHSKKGIQSGADLDGGVADGIDQNVGVAVSAAKNAGGQIAGALNDSLSNVKGNLGGLEGAFDGAKLSLSSFASSATKSSTVINKSGKSYDNAARRADRLSRSTKEGTKSNEDYTFSIDNIINAVGSEGNAFFGVSNLAEQYGLSLQETKTTNTEVKETTEETAVSVEELGETLDTTAEKVSGAAAKGSSAAKTTEDSIDHVKAKLYGLTDEFEKVREAMEENISGQIDIFSEFDKKTDLTSDQLLNNMQSQVDGVTEWAKDMQVLAQRGIDDGLLAKLSDLGPKGYEKVKAFVGMTDEQLQRANDLYAKSLALPEHASAYIVQSYQIAGRDASAGFKGGIDEDAGKEKATALGTNTVDALKTSLDEHSPSKKTEEVGKYAVQGLANGLSNPQERSNIIRIINSLCRDIIQKFEQELAPAKFEKIGKRIMTSLSSAITSNLDKVSDAVKTVCSGIVKGFEKHLDPSTFKGLGGNIITGLIEGIKANAEAVVNALKEIINNAVKKAKEALGIKSPSRVFKNEIGKFVSLGFAEGIKKYGDKVSKAGVAVADDLYETMKSALQVASDTISNDVDAEPVITPILDLSRIQNQAKSLNEIFEKGLDLSNAYVNAVTATRGVGVKAPIVDTREVKTSQQTQPNTYSFTQNNYSPKSLSQIELYRQTKNLFTTMKGAVNAT